MRHRFALIPSVLVLLLSVVMSPTVGSAAEGQLTWGVHISLAPTWFDPAETSGIITPYMVYYALHDALVKPMPGQPCAPSLAESWSVSKDGLVYEFVLRKGVKFHNGEPVTAEDVKFSFERYRGSANKPAEGPGGRGGDAGSAPRALPPQAAVARLPDLLHQRHRRGWIVPKKYVEKVGDEGFKKAPVGAGPYKFVSFTPGVELVMEAYEQYWRKTPERQAPGVQGHPRRVHPPGRAQARRGRHRLLDPRRARRGAAAHARGSPSSRP